MNEMKTLQITVPTETLIKKMFTKIIQNIRTQDIHKNQLNKIFISPRRVSVDSLEQQFF